MKAPRISPCLGVPDTQAACDFYEQIGFTALPADPSQEDDIRLLLFEGEFALMVNKDEDLRNWLPVLKDTPIGAFGMFYLAVDDFDAYVEKVRPLVKVVKEPFESHGQKLFYFTDPNGYVVGVTQRQEW
ncbi:MULTISPECIES: VOC family protein [unclassified Streptomyces]|uniref:VOC family protein n=1 Tax=unclassified Streptomyces TaxID=2593676 RepID=UPI00036CBDFC|nr:MULTISPECIES: VOC family protein [unclassified Streptomyces]MYT33920.1 glyoxalase/bleomycin resistance/dioxygenase family protein [Streptomyces sp. SID8354]